MDKMYSFDEIGLIPASTSAVPSRSSVYPYYEDGKLPLFVAPMTCILNETNYDIFNKSVHPVFPIRYNNTFMATGWVAVTLAKFREMANSSSSWDGARICVDVADGHMQELYDLTALFKKRNNDVEVMIGNIANPITYKNCCDAGVDYVRVGIGGGSGCTTSVQTGFHASLPWLLTEIVKQKKSISSLARISGKSCFLTKIVADGGINSIDKAIKALALGADYVMMGKSFAECEESAAQFAVSPTKRLVEYYGQSSEKGQMDRFGKVKSNPEGCSSIIEVKYTLDEYLSKFEAALRSAMSYAGAFSLYDFVGRVGYNIQSIAEYNSYNK